MDKDDPKPKPQPSGVRLPPRKPPGVAIGLGPDDDEPRRPDWAKNDRMTVSKKFQGEGKFTRESGGRNQHGHVILTIEPNGQGEGNVINSDVPPDKIPEECIKGALKGITMGLNFGLGPYPPFTDVIVRVVGGSIVKAISNELAFQLAGLKALMDAQRDALKNDGLIVIKKST